MLFERALQTYRGKRGRKGVVGTFFIYATSPANNSNSPSQHIVLRLSHSAELLPSPVTMCSSRGTYGNVGID